MKNTSLSATLLAGLLLAAGCSSKTDSTQVADKANDQKIDNADSARAPPMTANSQDNSKDVADYLVGLANTGRTEFELSQAAAGRASSAAVKTYARQTVTQHAKDEQELKAEAAKYSITLPTTLSNDSQQLLASLNQEQAGTAFDKKYLDDMVDVNDKAIGKAKDLVDKTSNQELKDFVQKIMRDDDGHLNEAKKLKDSIK